MWFTAGSATADRDEAGGERGDAERPRGFPIIVVAAPSANVHAHTRNQPTYCITSAGASATKYLIEMTCPPAAYDEEDQRRRNEHGRDLQRRAAARRRSAASWAFVRTSLTGCCVSSHNAMSDGRFERRFRNQRRYGDRTRLNVYNVAPMATTHNPISVTASAPLNGGCTRKIVFSGIDGKSCVVEVGGRRSKR